jgi:hypothetical protein
MCTVISRTLPIVPVSSRTATYLVEFCATNHSIIFSNNNNDYQCNEWLYATLDDNNARPGQSPFAGGSLSIGYNLTVGMSSNWTSAVL